MARRLISFAELDRLENLIEHHRQLQERLETLKAGVVEFDTPVQTTLELSTKADALKRELTVLLEQSCLRVRQRLTRNLEK